MTNSPKHNYPRQPAHIQPYVVVLGLEDTIRFLLAFGGAELYLTSTPKGRSKLAKMFGLAKAAAVAKAAEHMPRRVPTAKPWIAQVWAAQGPGRGRYRPHPACQRRDDPGLAEKGR